MQFKLIKQARIGEAAEIEYIYNAIKFSSVTPVTRAEANQINGAIEELTGIEIPSILHNDCNVAINDPPNVQTTRVSLEEMAKRAGYDNTADYVIECGNDSVVPACCEEECQVEPDGRCEHGNPSILLAAGII